VRVAGIFQGMILAMLKVNLKYKWAIAQLCLLLFVTAVDTIPDPPAINPPGKPPGGHSINVSALHLRGPFTLLELEWSRRISSPQRLQNDRLWFRLALDSRPARISPCPGFITPRIRPHPVFRSVKARSDRSYH
jgi:hypothetical protein